MSFENIERFVIAPIASFLALPLRATFYADRAKREHRNPSFSQSWREVNNSIAMLDHLDPDKHRKAERELESYKEQLEYLEAQAEYHQSIGNTEKEHERRLLAEEYARMLLHSYAEEPFRHIPTARHYHEKMWQHHDRRKELEEPIDVADP